MKTAKIFLTTSIIAFCSACTDRKKDATDDNRIKVLMPDISIAPEYSMVYWTYGEYNEAYYLLAQSKISKKYGIEFRNRGCVVSDALIYFVKTNNEALFNRLQKKYPTFTEANMLLEMQDLVTFRKSLEALAFSTAPHRAAENRIEAK